ncbi:methylmalonyl-CoA mutase [Nonlabens sp. YIK11]|uniref:methylmalonyl-CoA mutase subunit beta n=1 Tax=Nonlabens sp. YIK11 TaxID=1453349 RepID=UPI0006DCB148|nr:methylmalonyl-CoA mutase subunit beta [Nonlabens sp. YIK11]KQC33784.1 methylmalonyl-CoA mutase [Nonlabens sp. YIK11]
MKKRLFDDFTPVSEAAWKQKIQMDLKGADYNQTLVTPTPDGINIKPIYHSDSAVNIDIPSRGTQNNDWYISQKIYCGNARAANKKALNVLSRGAEGVLLDIPNPDIDLEVLLKDLPEVGLQVHPRFLDLDFLKKLHGFKPKAYVHLDILHQLAATGNWFTNQKSDYNHYADFLKSFEGYFSNITINTSTYQQAGATVTQELAYFAAHLNEYLNHYCDTSKEHDKDIYDAFLPDRQAGPKAETVTEHGQSKRINIDTTIGSNYFMEIAKYRAYRILTKTLGNAYGIKDLGCYITATPSLRNKSLLDYNVNLLRTTTECMSAVLGGADTVHNLPYDAFFNKENEFGDRIARNQLLILKEEAYLNKVANAADGTYYINALTKELTEKALEIFKSIEKAGGFVQSLFEGTIQRKIKESDIAERDRLKKGEKTLVGVNKFPNAEAPLQKEYEILPFQKIKPRKALVTPIAAKRLAEELEKSQMPK